MKNLKSALVVMLLVVFSANASADKQWTILVFLNGFNDLDASGYLNLNQMEKVGSTDDVNVVVEWGSMAHPTSTKRLLVKKDNDTKHVTSPVIEELGKVDMGDPAVLKDFLLWGMQNYPAQHYFVVVWDHGSGWHFAPQRARPQDISWDDLSGHAISTEALGEVIRETSQALGRKIDIYGSDACLMAMAEIAGEMDGAIDYFVGSQELEPDAGWPYDKWLKVLTENPGMAPADVSKNLAALYLKEYNGKEDVTFSAFDMSQFAGFESAMTDLKSAIMDFTPSELKAVLTTVKATQTFDADYGDVGDLVRRLNTLKKMKSSVIAEVENAVQAFAIANVDTKAYPHAQGVSVWLPRDKKIYATYEARYKAMNFDRATQWSSAIAGYLHEVLAGESPKADALSGN